MSVYLFTSLLSNFSSIYPPREQILSCHFPTVFLDLKIVPALSKYLIYMPYGGGGGCLKSNCPVQRF